MLLYNMFLKQMFYFFSHLKYLEEEEAKAQSNGVKKWTTHAGTYIAHIYFYYYFLIKNIFSN